MDIVRLIRHLLAPQWVARRAFSSVVIGRIETEIRASEAQHRGEIRFVVEAGLDLLPLLGGITPRERAIEVFAQLGVWDTAENTGVLIYVQWIDHDIEIVADRGISAKVPQDAWEAVCHRIEEAFRARRYEEGVLAGIREVTELLTRHFPAVDANRDELPNRPEII
jgi:uncharacterized membrane protein YgcG